MFEDENGRTRIFHGVNAVYKVPPWHPVTDHFDPQTSLSSQDIANLKEWGFNAVRLGMMWPGVEPTRGHYNESYLEEMKKIVNMLGEQGIYTILDFHQDVLNRKFCGEGIPDWAVNENYTFAFPLPVAPKMPVDPKTGYPPLEDCLKRVFGEYYFTDAVGVGFQSLYDNVNGIRDRFAAFWKKVGQEFKDSQTVLGYELINEPWLGDLISHPSYIIPGNADKHNLFPMYQQLHSSIRQEDNNHMIFFEKALIDAVTESGFTEGPGGKEYNDRQVFSYHVYCAQRSDGDPRNLIQCDAEDAYLYYLSMKDVAKLGCGGFMTEFGAESNKTDAVKNLNFLTGVADTFLQSWSYWQFKLFRDITTAGPTESFYGEDGSLEEAKVKALSRTYAQAIAGEPLAMTFDPSQSTFNLVYNSKPGVTEIFLNEKYYYENGFTVIIEPNNIEWKKVKTNYIQVTTTKEERVSITIRRK